MRLPLCRAPVKRVEANPHSAIQTISHGSGPSPPRLSIVVLPFVNVGNDPEQHSTLVDGITEDLTTDLSRLESMLVISRNTALATATGSSTPAGSAASSACAMC